MKHFLNLVILFFLYIGEWLKAYDKAVFPFNVAMGITPVAGLKGTADVTNRRIVIDMDDTMYEYEPDSQALLILLSKVGKGMAKSYKHEWQEDDYAPMYGTIDGDQNAEASPLVLTSVMYRVNDIVTNPLEAVRNFIVTAIPDATHITVAPVDGGAAADWDDGDKVMRVGNAHEEGSGKREILSTQPDLLYNYTQIFKTPFGATNTLSAIEIYGGAELDRDRKKMGVNHDVEIQRAILWGERFENTAGAHPKRGMGGIINFVTTKVKDMAGAILTPSEWENFLELGFEYGNDTKYAFCSSRAISYINSFASDKVRVVPKDKTFGIHVTEYISPHGTVYLINAKKLLNVDPWNKMIFLLDLPNIKYTPLKGRDTKLEMNIQNNDEDQEIDQFITEATCKVIIEESHAIMEDIG